MRAFVSYSFNDSELHIISLLFEQLRKSGYMLTSSSAPLMRKTEFSIQLSDVFIGIITNNSKSINHVIYEWKIANQNKIKSILLIEEGVKVDNSRNISFIRFNRNKPQLAIEELFSLRPKKQVRKVKQSSEIGEAIIGGGILVGLAALLSLLGDSKK